MKSNLYSLIVITALLLNCNQTSKDISNKHSQIKAAETVSSVNENPVNNESSIKTEYKERGIQPNDSAHNLTGTSSDTIQSESLDNWDTLCRAYTGYEHKSFDLLKSFFFGGLEFTKEYGSSIGSIAEAAACGCKTQRFKDSIQHYANSYDYKSACFNIKRRIELLNRAKPFIEKHGQLRKYLAEHSDIQYEDYWSCNPLTEFKKALVFWWNRQTDGTKKHFETIAQETSSISQQITGASSADTGKPPCSGVPVFFTPNGLYCNSAVAEPFDKKSELLQVYIEDVFAIEYGLTGLAKRMHEGETNRQVEITSFINDNNDRAGGEIKDAGMLDTLMNLKSVFFCKEYDYYALVREDEKRVYWKKTAIKPRLFVEFQVSCVMIDIVKLFISTVDNDSVLLFSGLPQNTKSKPSGYVPLPAPSTIELAIACTDCDTTWLDSSVSDTAWEWNIPVPDKNIKRLFAAGWHGHYEGRQVAWIELFIENENGKRIKLGDNRFCGHMWCYDATISNPYLTDANGDGLTDVVVNASDNEKILFLQLPSGNFEKRTITPYETHRSGGC
jgi:hypothetical protein